MKRWNWHFHSNNSLHRLSHPGVKPPIRLIKGRISLWPSVQSGQMVSSLHFPANAASVNTFPVSYWTVFSFLSMSIRIWSDLYLYQTRVHSNRGCNSWYSCFQFCSEWIYTFGVPLRITMDRTCQFQSQLFQRMAKIIGTRHTQTKPYHPGSNGLVERFHTSLKATIRCYATER